VLSGLVHQIVRMHGLALLKELYDEQDAIVPVIFLSRKSFHCVPLTLYVRRTSLIIIVMSETIAWRAHPTPIAPPLKNFKISGVIRPPMQPTSTALISRRSNNVPFHMLDRIYLNIPYWHQCR
jgi:hypothetical protein